MRTISLCGALAVTVVTQANAECTTGQALSTFGHNANSGGLLGALGDVMKECEGNPKIEKSAKPDLRDPRFMESADSLVQACAPVINGAPMPVESWDRSIRFYNDGKCITALTTARDLISVDRTLGSHFGVCLPPTSTLAQMERIFAKHVADHPEQGHYNYASTMVVALQKAFPCR